MDPLPSCSGPGDRLVGIRERVRVDELRSSIMSDNPSFVLKKIDDVAFEERPVPEIDPHEVLIAVKKTGMISVLGSGKVFMVIRYLRIGCPLSCPRPHWRFRRQ